MEHADLYMSYVEKYPMDFSNQNDAGIMIVTEKQEIERIESVVKRRLVTEGKPIEWAEVGVVYQDAYLTILRDAVLFQPGAFEGTYIRLFNRNRSNGVVILPLYNGNVYLLRIFRHALRKYVLEVPRGFGESGMSDEQNALRELREEIGAVAKTIHNLGYAVENSGLGNARTALFYVDIERLDKPSEDKEGISNIIPVPVENVVNMIKSGEIEDSFTITIIAKALMMGYI